MKSLFVAALLFAGLLSVAQAQSDADSKYVGIYGIIQQADQLGEAGEPGEALAAFADAQSQLQQFKKVYPDWNPNIITFRLNLVTDRIAALKGRMPASVPSAGAGSLPVTPVVPTPQAPPELDAVRSQLQGAQAANDLLQAKLKEALAAQPAAIDPRELARAQEKIRQLMKENDLLKVSHASVSQSQVKTLIVTNVTTVYVTNRSSVVVTNFADAFVKNQRPVIVTNYIRTVVVDTNALETLRLDLAAAVKNFNNEHARAEQTAAELQKLRQSATPTGANDAAALAALREENASLKAEVDRLRSAAGVATGATNEAIELKQARAQIAALQSDAEVAALEKKALQNRLQQALSATNGSAGTAALEARIRELMLERNDLIERLDAANRQKSGGKNAETPLATLQSEVSTLRSRLAVAEAQPVPYTAEELALFKASAPQPANPDAGKKSIKQMPAGTVELVASAQQHFARHQFDQAEADYQKILDHDQNNGIALANLATIELQQDKLADAEKHIKAALRQSPDDPYNLSTLGYLKFRQEKYGEALNALSRAAQLDPNNPEIQNYLGVTLSHEGQRKPAETALRRAIQLAPNYAPAHNNLAVIYLGQTPPLPELARWHYQKAVAGGQPRNPDLEKLLADKGASVAQ